jgi:Helix-hairpin-helix containing domain
VRIFKTYGADAVQVMSQNPYRLARDIRGIGFKTADAIAMKLGIEKSAMIRIRAGISYALTEAMNEGHCGLPTDELAPLAEKLLEAPADFPALQLAAKDRPGDFGGLGGVFARPKSAVHIRRQSKPEGSRYLGSRHRAGRVNDRRRHWAFLPGPAL